MSEFHLASLPVEMRGFRRWSALRGFAQDEGRALHHLLSETFGKSALRPFRLMVAPGAAEAMLYAYSGTDAAELRQIAAETAAPEVLAICDMSRLASKPMPEQWREGRRLAFDLRAWPTRRLVAPAGAFSKGAEIDAYLAEVLRRSPEGRDPADRIEREEVYRDWLRHRLGEAARLDSARIARFERRSIQRETARTGPDVTFHGELVVTDSNKFAERLASGVGRHGAYGFGMLLLRPAR